MFTAFDSKTLPSEAAKAMMWKGTVRGSSILSGARGDEELMAANDANEREHKLAELLDPQQFKAFFGGGRGALITQIRNLEAAIAEAELQALDPLRRTLSKLSTADMVRKLKMIKYARKSDEDVILMGKLVSDFDAVVVEAPLEGQKIVKDRASRLRLILRLIIDIFILDVNVTSLFPAVLDAPNDDFDDNE
jgi:hypothetical protein